MNAALAEEPLPVTFGSSDEDSSETSYHSKGASRDAQTPLHEPTVEHPIHSDAHSALAVSSKRHPSIPLVIEKRDFAFLDFEESSGKAVLPDSLRIHLVTLGSSYFQNKQGPFFSKRGRCMNPSWFIRKLGDGSGEKVERTWLVYSPLKAAAFCFCCLLFKSKEDSKSALILKSGLDNWKKPEKIAVHEKSPQHRECLIEWKEMEKNLRLNQVIDAALQASIMREKQQWRHILKALISCIEYLAAQNMALRGHREDMDVANAENFRELVKLISNFDSLLKAHLTRSVKTPGTPSYLSPEIQNEIIHLMAEQVRDNLLTKIRKAKYYGILVDSSPDLAHREQLSLIVRYIDIDYELKEACVRESFLGFSHEDRKDAESVATVVLEQLEKLDINFSNCRSQCYDNASTMSGRLSGVNARLLAKNSLALFVNCDNHSLNLAGVHSVKHEPVMITFFGAIESLFVFFSASPKRWDRMKAKLLTLAVESESETRWSSRFEAVKVVHSHILKIIELSEDMCEDQSETSDTRSDARLVLSRILTHDFLTLLGFWCEILGKIDRVQKRLQDPLMNFHEAAADLKALRNTFSAERNDFIESAIVEGQRLCTEFDVAFERRSRKKKMMPDETARDSGLTAIEEMRRLMFAVIERFTQEMDQRFTRLTDLDRKFGFLLDTRRLLYESYDELQADCASFGRFYKSDVDGKELYGEIQDCKRLPNTRPQKQVSKPEELLNFIIQYGDESVFPNLRVAIQILLTVAVSVAGCERSFSKLKLILTYLRASMGQSRLSDLALLSIERETTERTDYEALIDKFASVKARKVIL